MSELFLCFGELVQTGMGDARERKDLDQRIFVVGSSRRRIKEGQHLRIHPAPQEGFSFKNPELPSPFWVGIAQSLQFSISVFLTLF
ncbi:MAG: hypothetical protein ACHP9V_04320 [Terriglobales bacterium]